MSSAAEPQERADGGEFLDLTLPASTLDAQLVPLAGQRPGTDTDGMPEF